MYIFGFNQKAWSGQTKKDSTHFPGSTDSALWTKTNVTNADTAD